MKLFNLGDAIIKALPTSGHIKGEWELGKVKTSARHGQGLFTVRNVFMIETIKDGFSEFEFELHLDLQADFTVKLNKVSSIGGENRRRNQYLCEHYNAKGQVLDYLNSWLTSTK